MITLDREAHRDLYLCRAGGWCPASPLVKEHFSELVFYDRCAGRWQVTLEGLKAMAAYEAEEEGLIHDEP